MNTNTTRINEAKSYINKLSKKLEKHTLRNKNIEHINFKVHYLLHDPFLFINAYSKISKNKGAMTRGFDDEGVMKFFGLESAKIIANKLKKYFSKIVYTP